MPESCLTNEQLRRLLDSGVSADEQVKLRQHLDRCGDCRKRLETLAGGTAWLPPAHGLSQGKPSANSPELVQAMKQLRSETTEVHQEKALPSDITAPGFLSPPGKPGIIGRLGDYEILVEISRGGMGIVFKAHDPSLDRVVAIKVLAPELASRTNARSRFLREARAAAAVTHEHVITIHAVEETPAVPYLVMQFIGGRTLEERIGDKPLTLVEILRIGFQIASGLEAAHQHGLIHRDIKPGNILLENSVERVKITDFGLARAAEDTNLTQTGYVAGTPEYMAPEQVRGEAIDQRADLFSLGCVLYKMCTGVSPFRAPTLMGVLHKVCNEAHESARALNPQLSERLSQLIDRLLAKEPSQRPQTAHEIARKLSRYLARLQENEPDSGTGSEPQTRPKRLPAAWSWARRGKSWVVALISVALIGIAIRAVWFKPIRNAQSVAPNHASASTAPSPFVVAGSDGSRERGTLQEAVQAAPPGAVIECRFDGDQELDPISLGNKPLILRAAPGFHPAFTPRRHTEPLLLTRAALVIEGLTFKGGPAVTPPLEDRKGAAPSPAIIEVLGAPILLANCHFGIPPADPQADPAGCCVRLLNAAYGHFENCEFYTGPGGCAIATDRHSAAQNNAPPDQIIVRNCVQRGWMLVSLSRVDRGDTTLHLTRNIVSGTGLLNVNLRPATPPWAVFATQNVFDVAYLLQTLSPADQRSPQKLVQWHDRQNLFSFRPARADAQTLPGAKTFNEDVLAGGTNGSVVLPVNIFRRMNNLPMDGEKHDVRHFLLSPQEEAEVKRQTPGLSGMLGINPEIAGPGEGYDAWRKTPQYREWQKLVEQHTRAR
jgi:serine/threonine protein kinase